MSSRKQKNARNQLKINSQTNVSEILGFICLTEASLSWQIVPAMLGFFAYKAAALVQVYRDNEDLRLIFPDNEENLNNY